MGDDITFKRPSRRNRHQEPPLLRTSATLTVDLGFSSASLCLYTQQLAQNGHAPVFVPIPNASPEVPRYAFPVYIDMFNANSVGLEECIHSDDDGDLSSGVISARFLFLTIRIIELQRRGLRKDIEVVDQYLQDIPQLAAFFQRYNQLSSEQQGRVLLHGLQVFGALLRQFRAAARATASANWYIITTVNFTVPAYWDEWMLHQLRPYIWSIWSETDHENVFILRDTECRMHLFAHRVGFDVETDTQFLFVNYSDHILEVSTVLVRPAPAGQDAEILRSDWSFAKHGGSAIHAAAAQSALVDDDQLERYIMDPVTALIERMRQIHRDQLDRNPDLEICVVLTGDMFDQDHIRTMVEAAAGEYSMIVRPPPLEAPTVDRTQPVAYGAAIGVQQLPRLETHLGNMTYSIALGNPANLTDITDMPWDLTDQEHSGQHTGETRPVDVNVRRPSGAWLVCRPSNINLPHMSTRLFSTVTALASLGHLKDGQYSFHIEETLPDVAGGPAQHGLALHYQSMAMQEQENISWTAHVNPEHVLSLDLPRTDEQPLPLWPLDERGYLRYLTWLDRKRDPAYHIYWKDHRKLPLLVPNVEQGGLEVDVNVPIPTVERENRTLRDTPERQIRAICQIEGCFERRQGRRTPSVCSHGRQRLGSTSSLTRRRRRRRS